MAACGRSFSMSISALANRWVAVWVEVRVAVFSRTSTRKDARTTGLFGVWVAVVEVLSTSGRFFDEIKKKNQKQLEKQLEMNIVPSAGMDFILLLHLLPKCQLCLISLTFPG